MLTLLHCLACAEPESPTRRAPLSPTVPDTGEPAPPSVPTLAEYTAGCEAVLGDIPSLSCDTLPLVAQAATTAEGVVPLVARTDAVADGTCDRPSLLSGCVPGSRAGWVENDLGSRFYLLCRVNRSTTAEGLYDDIAMIGRNEASGATCMWGAPEDGLKRGGDVPEPGSAADVGYWADVPALAAISCRTCHDGNAIVVTPWIRENLPDDLDPLGSMSLIWEESLAAFDARWSGMAAWVHPEAAPCTGCHVLPEGVTCFLGPAATGRLGAELLSPMLRVFPTNRWMDDFDPEVMRERHGDTLGWETAFGAASERLLACCGGIRENCWSKP